MELATTVDIAAPPETVWAVMSDVERWHEWTASIRSIRLFGRGPLAAGSRALVRQPRFPPALWTVTALEPGRSFNWRSGMPGMWVDAEHTVTPSARGARVELRLRFRGALAQLLGRLTRDISYRYLQMEAAGLRRRSEERAQAARSY